MNINLLEEYNECRMICEYLGFTDTDQLRYANFYSQEESYSLIDIIGFSISNSDLDWRLCEVDESRYNIEDGYKITLVGCGNEIVQHSYYQIDFLSLLKSGNILYSDPTIPTCIENVSWIEPLTNNTYIVHNATVVKRRTY